MDPTDHLFRHEAGRMVAALTRIFGVHNLALAEDVVQDAFCRALETWKYRGIPENPAGWLMKTAKNRAMDVIRRERNVRTFSPDLGDLLSSEWTLAPAVAEAFEAHSIQDDELRMMFSCCHPRLPDTAQVALILNVCCGFSVKEIASAFLVSNSAMEKRIERAKGVFVKSERLFQLDGAEDFSERLSSVQQAIYLLFNEGYHGASAISSIRTDFCFEALRLGELLLRHRLASTPSSYALNALMCLNAARLPGRVDQCGHLTALGEQDRSLWDRRLITLGLSYLEESAAGTQLSPFHLEAGIASVHARAKRIEDTNWGEIVSLYELLLSVQDSPIVELNRAIAISQLEGSERGLQEIRAIADRERLMSYPFYFAALGELEVKSGRPEQAAAQFESAVGLARNAAEREFLSRRLVECRKSISCRNTV